PHRAHLGPGGEDAAWPAPTSPAAEAKLSADDRSRAQPVPVGRERDPLRPVPPPAPLRVGGPAQLRGRLRGGERPDTAAKRAATGPIDQPSDAGPGRPPAVRSQVSE